MKTLEQPKKGDYSPFFSTYLKLVSGNNYEELVLKQSDSLLKLFTNKESEWAEKPYAEGKWTPKEVLGHMIDTERIMTFRALCFARGEKSSLPGFDQDPYVLNARFGHVPIDYLLDDFVSQRMALLSLLRILHVLDHSWAFCSPFHYPKRAVLSMKLALTIIDAFTNTAFSGNPAAVCLLEQELSTGQMQTIAMEMNLSETAFVRRTIEADSFGLRWFTPTVEIDLCGHATLASAFWMVKAGWAKAGEMIRFQTLSGELRVKSDGEWIEMDFPLIPTSFDEHPFFTKDFFGSKITRAAQLKKNWIIELENAEELESCAPDFSLVKKHSEEGIIITAPGKRSFDIYSRFFGPNVGIEEDPVTGFAHCALMDYWFKRSGKNTLKAYQASNRGGILYLERRNDRVIIRGQAVKVLSGEIEF